MPFAEMTTGNIHYRFDGPADAPVLMLSNSLGTNIALWDPQIAALSRTFHVLRYDTRGHCNSPATTQPSTIEALAREALSLLDHLELPGAHFCGLSLGGMIGMWLAANAPVRLYKLILANTAPLMGPREAWDQRIAAVNRGGMAAIADGVIERWFTPAFRESGPAAVQGVRQMLLETPPGGYVACCAAIRDMDQRASLSAIRVPTLVIGATHDRATPPAIVRGIADAVCGARYTELAAAHLSNIEAAGAFNDAVADFLLD